MHESTGIWNFPERRRPISKGNQLIDKVFINRLNELEYQYMIKDCITVTEWFYFWSMDLAGFKYEWRNE